MKHCASKATVVVAAPKGETAVDFSTGAVAMTTAVMQVFFFSFHTKLKGTTKKVETTSEINNQRDTHSDGRYVRVSQRITSLLLLYPHCLHTL